MICFCLLRISLAFYNFLLFKEQIYDNKIFYCPILTNIDLLYYGDDNKNDNDGDVDTKENCRRIEVK